jgi:glycosyltransferase involved in cell wall biosynthesis
MQTTSSPSDGSPLVSAIIATYNRGYVVCEAIDSVLRQTYQNIDIIVVDDGSTDDTQAKLQSYGDRIRVVYQKNAGPAAAWNTGIRNSHGSIISFLGSDDLWLPTFVERQVALLRRCGQSTPCCLSNGVLRFANGRETTSFGLALLHPPHVEAVWSNVLEVLATRFVMCGQMIAIRREVLDRIGEFDESLRYLEDYDIALRLSMEGPWGVIRDPLVIYRQSGSDSLSLKVSSHDAVIHEHLLKTREKINQAVHGQRRDMYYSLMRRATQNARRDLWFSRLDKRRTRLAHLVAQFYRYLEHYRLAIYRRSPWYPQMRVDSV